MFVYAKKIGTILVILLYLGVLDIRLKLRILFTKGRMPIAYINQRVFAASDKIFRALSWGNLLNHTLLPKRIELPENETFLILCNHTSILDILIVYGACIPHEIKFVAKKELQYNFPGVSAVLRAQKHLFVNRKSTREATDENIRSIREHLAEYDKATGIVVFPEGRRSLDGDVHSFKLGAIRLLQKERTMPIVYMGIASTGILRSIATILELNNNTRFFAQILGIYRPKNEHWERKELADTVAQAEESIRTWVNSQREQAERYPNSNQ